MERRQQQQAAGWPALEHRAAAIYAIEVVAQNANAAVMQALVDAGVDTTGRIAGNAVMAAANQGSLDIVRMLVEKGADPSLGMGVAVASRYPEIVEYLESKGVREEVPPLLIAARRGDLKALETSIAARVDLNAVDGGAAPRSIAPHSTARSRW